MSDGTTGFVKLYHPRGPQVTLPVPLVGAVDYAFMFMQVSNALDAGWLTNAPGLEAGEEKEMVAFVVHGQSEGQRGDITDFVLLYSSNDAYKFSFLKVYLNREQDVAAFEYASGMRLSDFPVYVGQDKPERGKNRQVDKFIIPSRKPFGVVFKANPKWSEEAANAAKSRGEMYTVPRRVFVRWVDQKPLEEDHQQPSEADQRQRHHEQRQQTPSKPLTGKAELDGYWKAWQDFFSRREIRLDAFDGYVREKLPICPLDQKAELWNSILAFAGEVGFLWSKEQKKFVPLNPDADTPY